MVKVVVEIAVHLNNIPALIYLEFSCMVGPIFIIVCAHAMLECVYVFSYMYLCVCMCIIFLSQS